MLPPLRLAAAISLVLLGSASGQGVTVPAGDGAPDAAPAAAVQHFDADPKWDGHRNRLKPDKLRITRQNFGYRTSFKAGGSRPGEIGGRVQRSIRPAYYAMPIRPRSLNNRMTASGTFAVHSDEGSTGTLFGWFNATESRGWRTSNSLAFRIDGNGGKYWVFFEYGTADWMTGGKGCFEGEAYQRTRTRPFAADGTPHHWTLVYDPDANGGAGLITFTLDAKEYQLPLAPGHKERGAAFDRFGIFNQQTTGGAMDVYFDDVEVDGRLFDFEVDPRWEGMGNDAEYEDNVLRPLHDFGFSPTHFAGGKAAGELGGLVWRDERPAYYADEVGPLTLDDPLSASGKLAFTAAGSDSGVYLGWFNSKAKRAKDVVKQDHDVGSFLAVMVEGPSRVGHYFRPAYRNADANGSVPDEGPIIRPDGKVHDWAIRYDPAGAGGNGRITVTYDGKEQALDLRLGDKARGATFDRFGLFNHQSGGNYVYLYVDDLRYTRGRRGGHNPREGNK